MRQVSSDGVAAGAFSRAVEIRFARAGVADQDVEDFIGAALRRRPDGIVQKRGNLANLLGT